MGTAPQKAAVAPLAPPTPPAGPAGAPVAITTVAPPPAVSPEIAPAPSQPDPYTGLDLPQIDTTEPYLPATTASTWDVMGAAWTASSIAGDVNGQSVQRRARLVDDMMKQLSPEAVHRITVRLDNLSRPADLEALVLAEVETARKANPGAWAAFPATADELTSRVADGQKADLEEAQAILDQPGGGIAEFLGGAARDATSAQSLLMMPLGGFGGVGLKMIGFEMLLGAAGNVANLPAEMRVASEMGLPQPSFLARAIEGAAMGGLFSGLAVGAHKARTLWRARSTALKAATPEGIDPLHSELAVDNAEAQLLGEPSAQESAAAASAKPGQPPTFDFRVTGNASPKTNRISYVFGRLVERGMDPIVAAGYVGNFMVESGPSLNPAAVGDSGRALGIAQWNDRGPALRAFAAKRGKDWHDLDTQIDFLFYEIETSEAAAYARIRAAKTPEEAALLVSQLFERPGVPHNERRVAFARSVAEQYADGRVPKWEGAALAPDGPIAPITTSRAYTRDGQVTAGDYRINVRYEVVDASTLRAASADLQPRDRTTVSSDAQVAKIAAELDPARLMPNPEAQNGAPIVGPDNIVESGNGRVMALNRAATLHPDRAAAYVEALTQAGYEIPPGVTRPVLIARRTSEMTHTERTGWVAAANVQQIARMTPAEMARVTGAKFDAPTLSAIDWTKPLTHGDNQAGLTKVFAKVPPEERGAFVKADGTVNAQGEQAIRAAVFSAAWDDPALLDLHLAGEAGDLKSLMQALEQAAPDWAQLRAEIRAGQIDPAFDITGFVQDAVRLIAEARRLTTELSGTTTPGIEAALRELLDNVDLFEGAISPLTAALVRKMWRDGKAAPAREIADFLRRYAADARKVGEAGQGALDLSPPGPRDVLAAIDPKTFGDLPEDLGQPRGRTTLAPAPQVETQIQGFDQGAASPEAIEDDQMLALDLVPEAAAAKPPAPVEAVPARSETFTPAAAAFPDPLAKLHAEFADLSIEMGDGTTMTAREIIDDLKADEGFDAFIQACAIPTGGAQ